MAHRDSVKLLASLLRTSNEARPVLLLGSGASFSSGVPLAAEGLKRLAKRVFADKIKGGAIVPEQVKLVRTILTTNFDNCLPAVLNERRGRRITPDEEDALLKAAQAVTGVRARLQGCYGLIVAAIETGCRRGELLGWQWADVDLDGREVCVRGENTKDDETRFLGRWADRTARVDAVVRASRNPLYIRWTKARDRALRLHNGEADESSKGLLH